MVIQHPVLFKVPLINSRGYHGLIGNFHNSRCLAPVCERHLDADAEGASIWPLSNTKYISAQVDNGAFHFLFQEIIFHFVSNITFGNGSKVDSHSFFFKTDTIAFQSNIFIINEGQSGLNS